MEIALPQCAFGDANEQPSAPSSPTQCLSVTKCTSPRSCCTRALAEEHRQQHEQHRHHHSHSHSREPALVRHADDQSELLQIESTSLDSDSPTASLSFPTPIAACVPSDVVERLCAINDAYAALAQRVRGESTQALLGAQ